MAVESTTVKTVVVGSGSTGQVVPIPFAFNANAEIRAVLTDANGLDFDLTIGTQYTLTGAGNPSGGELTTLIAVGASQKLTVVMEPEITQLRSYNPNDNFPAKSHEGALDKLTRICQRLAERIGRTFQISESGTIATLTNRIFGTDAQGKFKQLTLAETRTAIGAAAASHVHAWDDIADPPSTFPPSSHTHASNQISDSSLGGLGEADANKLVKFNIDGTLASVGLATYFSGFPANNYGNYMVHFRSDQSSYTVSVTADGGVLANNRNVLWGDRDGYVAITSSPSGVATFVDMRLLTGPFANDEIASNTVAIGQLYYTADGSVKRRMS